MTESYTITILADTLFKSENSMVRILGWEFGGGNSGM